MTLAIAVILRELALATSRAQSPVGRRQSPVVGCSRRRPSSVRLDKPNTFVFFTAALALTPLITCCQLQSSTHITATPSVSLLPHTSSGQPTSPIVASSVPQTFAWNGALSGSLVTADTQCPAPQGGYLCIAANRLPVGSL